MQPWFSDIEFSDNLQFTGYFVQVHFWVFYIITFIKISLNFSKQQIYIH